MSQEQVTSLADECFYEIKSQIRKNAPDATIEAIASQLLLARESRNRINEEGSVVRDMRGAVIAHPAIKIESDAIKLYTALMDKNRRF